MTLDSRSFAKNAFGVLLKQYRTNASMTQIALAGKLKIGSSLLSRWENGENLPQNPLEQIDAICRVLDLGNAEKWQLLSAVGHKEPQEVPKNIDLAHPAILTLAGALDDHDVPRKERDRFAAQVASLAQIWINYQKHLPGSAKDYENLSRGLDRLFDQFALQLYEAAGDAFAAEYDPSAAINWFYKAEKARNRTGSNEDAATLAIKRGDAWRSLFNRDEALNCYEAALKSLSEQEPLTFAEKLQQLTSMRKQASVYLTTQQDLVQDATKARKLLEDTQQGLKQIINGGATKEVKRAATAELSKTLNFLGWANALLDNPNAALKHRVAALESAKCLGDPYLLTLCSRLAGDDSRSQEDLDRAFKYYSAAIEYSKSIADQNDQTREVANIKRGIGNIYVAWRKLEDAKTYLEESRKAFEEMGDRTRMANVLVDLGNLYAAIESYNQAESLLRQAQIEFDILENKYYMNSVRLDMAEVCINQDDLTQAVKLVNEVEKRIASTPYRPLQLRVLELHAYLSILEGKPLVLVDAAYKNLCALARDGNSQLICRKHGKRYKSLMRRGDIERARMLLDHLIEAVDEVPGLYDYRRELEDQRDILQRMQKLRPDKQRTALHP